MQQNHVVRLTTASSLKILLDIAVVLRPRLHLLMLQVLRLWKNLTRSAVELSSKENLKINTSESLYEIIKGRGINPLAKLLPVSRLD